MSEIGWLVALVWAVSVIVAYSFGLKHGHEDSEAIHDRLRKEQRR